MVLAGGENFLAASVGSPDDALTKTEPVKSTIPSTELRANLSLLTFNSYRWITVMAV